VYLVGAGPGDPELLTLRAVRLLETADVVFHDDLVTDEVLALVHRHALVTSVGKRCGRPRITQAGIHALMIESARAGQSVVRLKSGDPLVFGRAGEEIAALREAGVAFEIVPGVTAALAAGATLSLPLTDRKSASKLIFCTGHHAAGKETTKPIWSGCGCRRGCALLRDLACGDASAEPCGVYAGWIADVGLWASAVAAAGGVGDGVAAGR
jgi:uroporphyrin-III C-methyltransferase